MHNGTLAEDDGTKDDYKCAEFGCDAEEEIAKELEKCAKDAIDNGLPNLLTGSLEQLWQTYSTVLEM